MITDNLIRELAVNAESLIETIDEYAYALECIVTDENYTDSKAFKLDETTNDILTGLYDLKTVVESLHILATEELKDD